ncbi:hypothetical protein HYV70_01785 [Candidatus Uhrbacteria bacterium]|nr:hypothetical protein [Candidatus Uhrbacteria bacterium]
MKGNNTEATYYPGKSVAKTPHYELFYCETENGRQCLMQIAKAPEHNGVLDRFAYVLRELKHKADELEEEHEEKKKDPANGIPAHVFLNYDLGFPQVVDSFISSEQGGCRINILAFREVERVSDMHPLAKYIRVANERCDLRTSIWIMGRTLKLIDLVHMMGFSLQEMKTGNILIQPEEHHVVLFNPGIQMCPGEVPLEQRRKEIAQATTSVIQLLGGNILTREFPQDLKSEIGCKEYTDHLLMLAAGGEYDAHAAYRRFYQLIDRFWERKFHRAQFLAR